MKRGDLITVAVQGDYGKPRPALVIQSDNFSQHPSITILPVTSKIVDAPLIRVTVEPAANNGLTQQSQIMIDKALTIPREKAGKHLGSIDYVTAQEIDRCLAVFLGIAK
ncbi:type II toxin-antitoxin system PemK/MazF family toxin [Chromatiaceae bacterium AAb-1]|nr:type II toxin-antitoxin system PemK/MazF family toxin [Chromatiaceae bacterium AAb-1]